MVSLSSSLSSHLRLVTILPGMGQAAVGGLSPYWRVVTSLLASVAVGLSFLCISLRAHSLEPNLIELLTHYPRTR